MDPGSTTENSFISTLNLSHSDQEGLQDTLATFTRAVQLHSQDSSAYIQLGLSLYHRCYPQSAIIAYNRAISITSIHATVFSYLGDALCEVSQYDDAIKAYNTAIELEVSSCSRTYINLAYALRSCSRLVEALDAVQRALDIDPECGIAHIMQGEILFGQSKADQAKEAIKIAMRLWPALGDMHIRLGVNLYEKRKLEEAVEVYRANFRDDFKWMYMYLVLSMNLRMVDGSMLSIAIKACELALKADSRSLYAYLSIALLCSQTKNKDKALDAAKSAVKLNSSHCECSF